MKKIGIIGAGDIEILAIAKKIAESNMDIVIVDVKTTAQTQKINLFESDPFIIEAFNKFVEEPKFYETEPSKYITKPKHNYKRR